MALVFVGVTASNMNYMIKRWDRAAWAFGGEAACDRVHELLFVTVISDDIGFKASRPKQQQI